MQIIQLNMTQPSSIEQVGAQILNCETACAGAFEDPHLASACRDGCAQQLLLAMPTAPSPLTQTTSAAADVDIVRPDTSSSQTESGSHELDQSFDRMNHLMK
jgi:hypothetical protein